LNIIFACAVIAGRGCVVLFFDCCKTKQFSPTNTDTMNIDDTPNVVVTNKTPADAVPAVMVEKAPVVITEIVRPQYPVRSKKETPKHDPNDGDPPIGEIVVAPFCSPKERKCSYCGYAVAQHTLILWLNENKCLTLHFCAEEGLCAQAARRSAELERNFVGNYPEYEYDCCQRT
jgi:hypothetical protein